VLVWVVEAVPNSDLDLSQPLRVSALDSQTGFGPTRSGTSGSTTGQVFEER
jgi:hypothetical protein